MVDPKKKEQIKYSLNQIYTNTRRSHADHSNKKQKHGVSIDDLYDALEDTVTMLFKLLEEL